jgi:hypothetical protein
VREKEGERQRERGRKEGRNRGREEGRKGGREEGRKGGREEGRKGGREGERETCSGVFCFDWLCPARLRTERERRERARERGEDDRERGQEREKRGVSLWSIIPVRSVSRHLHMSEKLLWECQAAGMCLDPLENARCGGVTKSAGARGV